MIPTCLAAAATLALALPAAAQNGVFLIIPGWNQALGVSGDGSTVTGQENNHAVLWNLHTGANTILGLGRGVALSYDASAAVLWNNPGDNTVSRWTAETGAVPIGSASTNYPGISGDGSTIVGTEGGSIGYRWTTTGGRQNLPLPTGGTSSAAQAVSQDGSTIVGGATTGTSFVPVVWRGGNALITTPLPPVANAALQTVNADGSVAFGFHVDQHSDSFEWTPSLGNQDLGFTGFGGELAIPYATTAAGDIFVGSSFGGQGWVWRLGTQPRTIEDILQNDYGIDMTGLSLFLPRSISADGRVIAGTGEYTNLQHFAWVVTLPWSIPSPSSALPLAALMLVSRRRRSW